MPPGPAASRYALGAELKTMRETAHRTLDEAAQALGCTSQKIHRLEQGNAVPTHADVLRLVELYGASDRRGEILVLLASAGAQEWFEPFRDVIRGRMFADHLLRFAAIEGDAAIMKLFEADLIPGLLQTDEYTDAGVRHRLSRTYDTGALPLRRVSPSSSGKSTGQRRTARDWHYIE